MHRFARAASWLALLFSTALANAQNPVYRCGNSTVFTDKPCDDAQVVDTTHANMLQAGPTSVPAPPLEPAPQPAIIWPNASRVVSTPAAPPSTIWSDRDARAATPAATAAAGAGRPGFP